MDRSDEETAAADICTYPAMAAQCGAPESSRCWNQAIQFMEPAELAAGKAFTLQAAHNPTRVFFRSIL